MGSLSNPVSNDMPMKADLYFGSKKDTQINPPIL